MEQQPPQKDNIVAFKKKPTHKRPVTRPIWRRVAFLHAFFMALGIAISGTLVVQIVGYLAQARQIDAQIVQAQEEAQKVETQNSALEQQVKLLQQDDYVAKLARSEYYLSKSGEIIFNTPQDAAQNKLQQSKDVQ